MLANYKTFLYVFHFSFPKKKMCSAVLLKKKQSQATLTNSSSKYKTAVVSDSWFRETCASHRQNPFIISFSLVSLAQVVSFPSYCLSLSPAFSLLNLSPSFSLVFSYISGKNCGNLPAETIEWSVNRVMADN